jgi:hypothetical protein
MPRNSQTSAGDGHHIRNALFLIDNDRGQQYQLLDWLEKITFPTEAAFDNPEHAKLVYPDVVNTTIGFGVRRTADSPLHFFLNSPC